MTSLTFGPSGVSSWIETRQYNTLGQMTRITIPGAIDYKYTFPTRANNGRITKVKDWITGEEVNYTMTRSTAS